jgi:Zn-dependent protease
MLGRISLNPVVHIDPIGTIVMPLIAMMSHYPTIGWAKPTPVDPGNFRHKVRDDVLTSVAGPVSNVMVAIGAVIILFVISQASVEGRGLVTNMPFTYDRGFAAMGGASALVPITFFFYEMVRINIILAVFNLIPVPPLDGSHVLRHFLSDSVRRVYDSVGMFALLALVFLGGNLLWRLISPFIGRFDDLIVKF